MQQTNQTGSSSSLNSVSHYATHASALADAYERIDPAMIHQIWLPCLPRPPADILDVGSGSGRDAAWLARIGHRVTAVEPADALLQEAQQRHAGTRIEWLADALPDLMAVRRRARLFDLILASAVWMHILPADRRRCLETFTDLLYPRGHLIVTLRHGPSPDARVMFPDTARSVADLSHPLGLTMLQATEIASDRLGRSEVSWQTLILKKG